MANKEEIKPVDVYSASAGSGKTYTLASRYIDMLISAPNKYQNILAVTFTNKATAEMMTRIIDDLYCISASTEKLTPAQQKRQEMLISRQQNCMRATNKPLLSQADIKQRCQTALRLILNDYRMFSVSTIDSFVQRVIRAFAFEMGFPASYGIELDSNLVVTESVDNLMRSISEKENAQLRNWLIEFFNSKADEGKWSIEGDIIKLAVNILSDDGRKFMDDIEAKTHNDAEFMQKLKKNIDKIIEEHELKFEEIFANYANNFPNGFPVDEVKGKSKAQPYTVYNICIGNQKTREKLDTILKKEDNKTFNDDSNNEFVEKAFRNLYAELHKYLTRYRTAHLIKKNIYVIGIMSHLSEKMNEWKRKNDMLPMSDSNDLLRRLIDGCELPFIYEKIGTKFHNIMIDEFQDTSEMQWNNFKPLISQAISSNNNCLLVGDTKQSIYRWRNSDWRNLANVGNTLTCNINQLETNWRSQHCIVAFNNTIFSHIRSNMQQTLNTITNTPSNTDLLKVFESCTQNIPDNKKTTANNAGFVQVKVVSVEQTDPNNNADTNEDTIVLQETINAIRDLHNNYNYDYGDICILVRRNEDGSTIMRALKQEGIEAVSTDSLKLTSSKAVVGIMGALRYLANPQDLPSLIAFMSASVYNQTTNINQLLNVSDDIKSQLQALNGMGLIEIVSQLTESYIKPELVSADFMFIEALTDTMRSYLSKGRVNLSDFIDYMDKNEGKISVIAPQSRTAVQVMTIHKSKGLEFKAVLIPFASWDIIKKPDDLLWVPTAGINDETVQMLNYLPITYNKNMKNTYFDDIYANETRMKYIDSLNELYVALTRAEEVLMIWGKEKTKKQKKEDDDENKSVFNYMLNVLKNQNDVSANYANGEPFSQDINTTLTPTGQTYTIGTLCPTNNTIANQQNETIEQYPLHQWNLRMVTTNMPDDTDEETTNRQFGIEMHSIMEHVRTLADLDAAFATATENGQLSAADATIRRKHIDTALTNPIAKAWFNVPAQHVYNEMSFFGNGQIKRPDRVVIDDQNNVTVIDYKFCAKNNQNIKKYQTQVQQYKTLFAQTGYTNINGYLWFLGDNDTYQPEIIEI